MAEGIKVIAIILDLTMGYRIRQIVHNIFKKLRFWRELYTPDMIVVLAYGDESEVW